MGLLGHIFAEINHIVKSDKNILRFFLSKCDGTLTLSHDSNLTALSEVVFMCLGFHLAVSSPDGYIYHSLLKLMNAYKGSKPWPLEKLKTKAFFVFSLLTMYVGLGDLRQTKWYIDLFIWLFFCGVIQNVLLLIFEWAIAMVNFHEKPTALHCVWQRSSLISNTWKNSILEGVMQYSTGTLIHNCVIFWWLTF